MTSKKPFLSIIIPLYNEENLLKNLSKLYKYLDKLKKDYEVLLVNDGSIDKTAEKLKDLNKRFKFQLISYNKNRDKGFAIRSGMLAAGGEYRIFTDIDLSTPIEEFEKFMPNLKKFDVIIGSRRKWGSNLKKRQPFIRETLGQGFTLLSQIVLDLNISDFTCGFKCFSKKAAEEIFKKQKIDRWGFDSEILYIAKKLRLKIKEVPVTWIDDPNSKVKFPQAIISSLIDLSRIRAGNYD